MAFFGVGGRKPPENSGGSPGSAGSQSGSSRVPGDFPTPEPHPLGVSHSGAEELCAQWMRHLGATDAKKTRTSADGGIDVISEKYVAQVKNFSGTVPVESVRELVGVGLVHERIPLFFTSGTYPTGAIEFANKGGVALFVYSAENGTLRPVNAKAKQLFSEGL
jgi:hypothetical protein